MNNEELLNDSLSQLRDSLSVEPSSSSGTVTSSVPQEKEKESEKHFFFLTEEEYASLLQYAEGLGETPQAVFEYWVDGTMDQMWIRESLRRERMKQQKQKNDDSPFTNSTVGALISPSQKEVL